MRRFVSLTLAATILGIAAMAVAAPLRHATADLTSLAASGVEGKAKLNEQPQGGTIVSIQFRNLQPGTEYVALFYANRGCEPEATQNVIGRFTANPAGNASFSTKIGVGLDQIGSLSVAIPTTMTVQACGAVVVAQ